MHTGEKGCQLQVAAIFMDLHCATGLARHPSRIELNMIKRTDILPSTLPHLGGASNASLLRGKVPQWMAKLCRDWTSACTCAGMGPGLFCKGRRACIETIHIPIDWQARYPRRSSVFSQCMHGVHMCMCVRVCVCVCESMRCVSARECGCLHYTRCHGPGTRACS